MTIFNRVQLVRLMTATCVAVICLSAAYAQTEAPVTSEPLPPITAEPAAPETTAPVAPAAPQRIKNPIAEFTGIDKITGRIITFDVYIDETVQFGALQVTPRVCYSRPNTEEPKTDSFVEVDEITLDRKIRRIFTGWMFAESPGLNAVEHAVYDVWLKSCKQKSDVPAPDAATAEPGAKPASGAAEREPNAAN